MARRKRYFPKREQSLKGTGYDSFLEKHLHETSLVDARFHSKDDYVKYIVPHTYQPDFVIEVGGKTYYIEAKGRFQDSSVASKYIHIRKALSDDSELVFVWDRPNTTFPYAKRRQDGTKATNEEWADKNGFRHWNQTEFKVEALLD